MKELRVPDAFLVIFWPGDEGIGNNSGNSIVGITTEPYSEVNDDVNEIQASDFLSLLAD